MLSVNGGLSYDHNRLLDEKFCFEIVNALEGRGVDYNLFTGESDNSTQPTQATKNIFLSTKPKDFNLNTDKSLILLKKHNFRKAFFLIWNSNQFKIEKYLNDAVIIAHLPTANDCKTTLKSFYLNYFLELALISIPNLPCKDKLSSDLTSLIKKVASTDATVLVNGPTGTGKELISNLIHHFSQRRDGAFVALNCAAIPDQMLESMLFGHEKGAFTGAIQPNKGILRAADNGTVLLDEISEMPISLQAKLLRVIQEKKVMPIGSSEERDVNVRIVATTNRNMVNEIQQGRFREDLYYRLNVFPVNTQKLSDRKEDIPVIIANMLHDMDSDTESKTIISQAALDQVQEYSWPGNVRELHNVIQRAKILCVNSEISPADLIFDDAQDTQSRNTAEVLAAKFSKAVSDEAVI